MSILDVTGGSLYYEEHGEGPNTIVFAHGAGGNHLSWWQQVPHFRDRYRCVTFDHRGFARSVDESGEGRKAFRRDLEELLDHLGVEHAVLVGQSMGGFSVLPYAVAHPDRVRALLMADTMLGIGDEALLADMQVAVQKATDRASAGAETSMVGADYLARDPNGVFLYQQVRGLTPPLEPNMTWTPDDGAVVPDQLSALTMPVIFLAGEFDAIIPPDVIERAQQMVPGSRYVSVPTGGHSVYWELPDEFNVILEGLLSEAYPSAQA
jgi:3-oxoadipate enol-lactonase